MAARIAGGANGLPRLFHPPRLFKGTQKMTIVDEKLDKIIDDIGAIKHEIYLRAYDNAKTLEFHRDWHENSDALLKECLTILNASRNTEIIALVIKIKERLS